jgi:hypothetical protein
MLKYTCPTCERSYEAFISPRGEKVIYWISKGNSNAQHQLTKEDQDCALCLEEIDAEVENAKEKARAKLKEKRA